jgi:predicted HAD superfamily hydrolase
MSPSAQSNYLNGVSSSGVYVETYAGTVKVEKVYSNNFYLNYVYKNQDVSLTANPPQNG